MTTPNYILIQHATVLSMDRDIGNLPDCDVLIKEDTIAAVGPALSIPRHGECDIIDGTDSIITPGFVDGHHHMWQQFLRSIATDWSLLDYLVNMRTKFGSLFTAEDVYFAQYAAGLSLLSNGITTVLDHCHIINTPSHADAAVRGLKDSGIRGTFCYGFYPNPPIPAHLGRGRFENFSQELRQQDAARVLREHFPDNNPKTSLLTFGIAPNEPESTAIETIKEELRQSRAMGARLITYHVAMGHYDIAKRAIVQDLANDNLLGPDIVFSHGASLSQDELAAIRESGAGIVATPDTELQMGMGHPVAFRAADNGCHSCLGIDITSNNSNDFMAQMRLALQTQRAKDNQESFPKAVKRKTEEVLHMATIGGAEVMRLQDLTGSITPGKKADVVLFRCNDINSFPILEPVGNVVFHMSHSNVHTVIVNGTVAKRDGELTGVDWPNLREEIRVRSKRILDETGKIDMTAHRKKWEKVLDL
jgi:cytosine/adenosine deaminase-related metal-dependent hydrolase